MDEPSTDKGLSVDQEELISTYSQLDRRGQHRVHTIIYEELDRMEQAKKFRQGRIIEQYDTFYKLTSIIQSDIF